MTVSLTTKRASFSSSTSETKGTTTLITKDRTPEQRAVLVGFGDRADESRETLEELAFLAETAGATVLGRLHQRKSSVHPGFFLSRGKQTEAKDLVEEHEANLLICDEDLSPAQIRNLEKELKVRVIDRSELILDIFAQRAQTREARIQVELAQLQYLLPRLVGMWGHLARTGGGIGTRGPGETQLEVDRRAVRKKISVLEGRLEKVSKERDIQSRRRTREFRASLVGYTNAGKSTLFNRLTQSEVLEEDKLFATLDTTTRKLFLDGHYSVLLSDTVGFIRKLPHHLVASFRATLREVETSDLLVHVIDGSHPAYLSHMRSVDEVLDSILEEEKPRLLVFNKADQFESFDGGESRDEEIRVGFPNALRISALQQEDRERVRVGIAEAIRDLRTLVRVECAVGRLGQLRALTQRGETKSENFHEDSVWSEVWLDPGDVVGLRRAGFRVDTVEV